MANNPYNVPFSTGFLDTGFGGGRITKQDPSYMRALTDMFGLTQPAFDPERDTDLNRNYGFEPLMTKVKKDSEAKSSDSGNLYETPDSPDYKSDDFAYIDRLPDIYEKIAPIQADQMRMAADLGLQQSVRQTAALYPYLDAASNVSTERALDASKRFLARKMEENRKMEAFRQSLPTTQQAIMSAKQQQQSAASTDFYNEALAMAKASEAAKDFAEAGLGKLRYGYGT